MIMINGNGAFDIATNNLVLSVINSNLGRY